MKNIRKFARVWESSGSVTEVSVRLHRLGYKHISPEVALVFSYTLRGMGWRLKEMPRGNLPDFVWDACAAQLN